MNTSINKSGNIDTRIHTMSPSDRKTSCVIKMADLIEKKEEKKYGPMKVEVYQNYTTKNYMMPRPVLCVFGL